jgi:hypothetical protein
MLWQITHWQYWMLASDVAAGAVAVTVVVFAMGSGDAI